MNVIPNPPLRALEKKIAFSTAIQYAGKILQLGLGMITIKLIAQFLSDNDYGVYASITEYALFFSVAANLGIFANVVRKMADEPLNGKIFWNALVLRVMTAFAFFFFALLYLWVTGVGLVFIVGAALFLGALFLDFITSVCDAMLQANYRMGRATLALTAGRVVSCACIFWLTRNLATMPESTNGIVGIWAILSITLLGSLLTATLSFYFVRQKIDWPWHIDWAFIKNVFRISLPFGIINILNNLYFRFLPDLFSHQILSEKQFATFNISFRIAQVASLLSTFLMFSVLPGFKEYIDQNHHQKAKTLYRGVWKILAGCGVLLVVAGSLFGKEMIELLTHKKYFLPEFWFVLPLMLLLAAISYGYDLILVTLFAIEQDNWLLKMEFRALGVALVFFGASFLPMSLTFKLILIIVGAIAGESVMVVFGARKIEKYFEKN